MCAWVGMELENSDRFGSEFLNQYLAGGFGRLSKHDIDVLVFYLLVKDGQFELPKDISLRFAEH